MYDNDSKRQVVPPNITQARFPHFVGDGLAGREGGDGRRQVFVGGASPGNQPANPGQDMERVEAIQGGKQRVKRLVKFENDDAPAGADDAGHFRKAALKVGDVTDAETDGDGIEGVVGEGQVLGIRKHQAHRLGGLLSPLGFAVFKHRGGEVRADDTPLFPNPAGEFKGEVARPRADIEGGIAGLQGGLRRGEPSPAVVQTGRKHRVQEIVAGGDAIEQGANIAVLLFGSGQGGDAVTSGRLALFRLMYAHSDVGSGLLKSASRPWGQGLCDSVHKVRQTRDYTIFGIRDSGFGIRVSGKKLRFPAPTVVVASVYSLPNPEPRTPNPESPVSAVQCPLMLRFIAVRLALAIPTLLAISFLVFVAAYLSPSDPVDILLGQRAAPEARLRTRHEWGLDRPLLVRYADYIGGIVTRGDFGRSYLTREPVATRIARGFPNTAALAFSALVLSLVIGIPLGIASAVYANKPFDRIAMGFALAGVAVPSFVLGPLLVLYFAVGWKVLPVIGFAFPNRVDPKYFVLPALVLALRSVALITRLTRAAMLETLGQDYIRTARAKGLSGGVVLFKHALKNAFPPILTVTGVTFGYLLSGSFVVETFFTIPGIGADSINCILNRDYPVIQGMALFLATIFVLVNLVVDVLYGFLDPRARTYGQEIARKTGAMA